MINLYLLWWNNGLEYADQETTLLGVYTDAEKRDEAEAWYGALRGKQWPFDSGEFVQEDILSDTELVEKRPAVTAGGGA